MLNILIFLESLDSDEGIDFLTKNIEPENLILSAWITTREARLMYKDFSIDDYYNTFKCL